MRAADSQSAGRCLPSPLPLLSIRCACATYFSFEPLSRVVPGYIPLFALLLRECPDVRVCVTGVRV